MDTAEFLRALYGEFDQGWLEITYLAPDGVRLFPSTVVQWRDFPLTTIDPRMPHVHDMNRKGYSVYFGVAVRREKKPPVEKLNKYDKPYLSYRRGTQADALCLTALWIDVDGGYDTGLEHVRALSVAPSIVVNSGGGCHAYWRLREPVYIDSDNFDLVKRTLRGMALACKSDTKVAEFARVMRLPETINTKPERGGAVCSVTECTGEVFDYAALEIEFAPLAAPAPLPMTRHIPTEASRGLPAWVLRYLDTGRMEGKRNSTLYGAAVEYLNNGFSLMDAERDLLPRALSDGLSEFQSLATIRSAFNRAMGQPNISTSTKYKIAMNDRMRGGSRS